MDSSMPSSKIDPTTKKTLSPNSTPITKKTKNSTTVRPICSTTHELKSANNEPTPHELKFIKTENNANNEPTPHELKIIKKENKKSTKSENQRILNLEDAIAIQYRSLNKNVDKVYNLEKALLTMPSNTTEFKSIVENQGKICTEIQGLETEITEIKLKMEEMKKMKDDAFDRIRDLATEFTIFEDKVQDDQLLTEKFLRQNRDNITNISQTVHDHTSKIRQILSKSQEHDIKLNATGKFSPMSPYQLTVDLEKYPILKSANNHHSHFSSLPKMLTSLEMEGDNLSDIQNFYDGINTAFMTVLSSNNFFPDYSNLHHKFDPKDHLLPETHHPQYDDATNIFNNMSRILLRHLRNAKTIPTQKAPATALILKENTLMSCGFYLLFEIVTKMSPQLGGHARDLETYVRSLQVFDGEPLLEYYMRALHMFAEIDIQKDQTGQSNKLIFRFVSTLFSYSPFSECLRPVMTDLNEFFLRPNNHLQVFHYSLPEIYQTHLKNKCAPQTISNNAKYELHTPQVSKVVVPVYEGAKDEVDSEQCWVQSSTFDLQDQKNGNTEELSVSPIIKASRMGPTTTAPSYSPRASYTPDKCEVCGLTQKECHQVWKSIHDPTDPQKCPFRGPKFIIDKQIRENVLQYNLKNSESTMKTANGDTPQKQLQEEPKPPASANIPTSKINSVNAMTVSPCSHISTPEENTTIASLISYIEDMAEKDEVLHIPKVSMMMSDDSSSPKVVKEKEIKPITPSQFLKFQE